MSVVRDVAGVSEGERLLSATQWGKTPAYPAAKRQAWRELLAGGRYR